MRSTATEAAIFFHPSPAQPVSDVLGALQALASRSRGEVRDGSELYPGFFETNEHGACVHRRVDHGLAFYEQEAHIRLPGGFLHPALVPAVASLLGWTEAETLAVARCRGRVEDRRAVVRVVGGAKDDVFSIEPGDHTGPMALAALLRDANGEPWREALILDRIPVVPLSLRPLVSTDGRHTVPGRINEFYRKLHRQAALHGELVARDEPPIILSASIARCQHLGEALCAAFAAPTAAPRPQSPERVRAWRPAGPPPNLAEQYPDPPPAVQPVGVAFDEEGGMLVQFPHALVHLTGEGRMVGRHAVPYGLQLLSVAGGRVLLFGNDRFHVLTLRSGEWADDYVPGFHYGAVFSDGSLRNAVNDASANIQAGGAEQELSADLVEFTKPCAASPDNHYIWMWEPRSGGAIFRVLTATREWDVVREETGGAGTPVLLATDALLSPGVYDEDTLYDTAQNEYTAEGGYFQPVSYIPACACVLTPDGRFRLLYEGVVTDDGEARLRLALPVGAAGFSRDGDRLAIASASGVRVISLEPTPRLLAHYGLEGNLEEES